MTLSILIPTIDGRREMLNGLLTSLYSQYTGEDVEILIDCDGGTIGAKRQRMIEKAKGLYVAFIDDDDTVSTEYIKSVLPSCNGCDVIGFRGYMTTNGKKPKGFVISKDVEYKEVNGVYYRFNNHLSPVRRELALQVGYKDLSYQEDYDYACRLRPLVKTEVFIDKKLYHYRYVSKKSGS